jgi:small GTP-binding protein
VSAVNFTIYDRKICVAGSTAFSMQRLAIPDVPQFKVPLIGDANAGKTSIVSRFTSESFTGSVAPTVGVSTVNMAFTIQEETLELSIWDTAGQEKFRSLVPLYTRNAALIILVFDRSSPTSFPGLDDWFLRVRNEMGATCPVFLCANKADLPAAIPEEAIEVWAQKNNCSVFFTSAMSGKGISEMFTEAAKHLLVQNSQQTPLPRQDLETGAESKCC